MKTVKCGTISVYGKSTLDGGGTTFGLDFVPIVREKIGKVSRVFEFCAGFGFIGFSLLANDLCQSLCLADVNPESLECAKRTVKENGLEDKVTIYLSNGLGNIPQDERWDLVVGNPPHFLGSYAAYKGDLRQFDPDWGIHREFYLSVKAFLNPRAKILLVENSKGSSVKTFEQMIEEGGLEMIDSFKAKRASLSNLSILFRSKAFIVPGRLLRVTGLRDDYFFILSGVNEKSIPASVGDEARLNKNSSKAIVKKLEMMMIY